MAKGRLARGLTRILTIVAAVTLVVWVAATAALYAAMCQPPARFGAIMSHVPMVSMAILPFKPLWMSARGGRLAVGDIAPDFTLPALHGERAVKLSDELSQKKKPVVLIFGSYT